MGFGKLQASPPAHCRMKSSSVIGVPFTTGWPSWTATVSPGPATILLMKLVSDWSAVGVPHGSPFPWVAPHLGTPLAESAPSGGWNTTMSPILGSAKW